MSKEQKNYAPSYERLKARPGWPCLDDPAPMLAQATEALATYHYYNGVPEPHTLEGKGTLVLTKLSKWLRRQASAQHHLAAVLTALQRPGSPDLKRELARTITERVEEYRALEDEILAALQESADSAG